MEVNDDKPLWYDYNNTRKRISNGRMWLWNKVVAVFKGDHRLYFITIEDLWGFFKGYTMPEDGFTAFVCGQSCYRMPNNDMTKFLYDPFTGEKIDWDAIRRYYREHIKKD